MLRNWQSNDGFCPSKDEFLHSRDEEIACQCQFWHTNDEEMTSNDAEIDPHAEFCHSHHQSELPNSQ